MNFLFDLINHASGYTHKYYDEHHQRLNTEQLIAKYRKEKKKFNEKSAAELSAESEILGDKNYPHCLLVIEGAHQLYRMKSAGMLPSDYIDSLILRLNTGNSEWYRNHFPVILETNMSQYFNETIYNDM